MLESVMCLADHYVVVEREGGLPQFKVVRYRDGATHAIRFPEPTYSASPGANAEYHTGKFRYRYSSFVTPESVFDHDLDAETESLLKRQPVLGGFERDELRGSERVFASALDGTKVPV
jgi:oligopeptidase B